MTAGSEVAGAGAGRVVYREPARTYRSSVALLGLLLAGFLGDLWLGGGLDHLAGWMVAVVPVVGVDALTTRAARRLRSLTVTGAQVRVGSAVLDRGQITGCEQGVDPSFPVLGRTLVEGLPRGTSGLALRLADGRTVIVPTRHPLRLAAALEVPQLVLPVPPAVVPALPAVRAAGADELARVCEIDERAESLFRVAGLDVPRLPCSEADLREAKVILVAGRPAVGFARVDEVDGLAHLAGLAVLPRSMRQGLGSAFLEAACAWSSAHGYPAITLITYADVAWNAPFYCARGFVEFDELTSGIAALRAWERDAGLDALGRRIVMRRTLPDLPPRADNPPRKHRPRGQGG